jgi:hypothetical protein
MDKIKIFELKIEEDDDVSGVDQISLVDEPAIEVNWIAFNKEKAHEFHIPDGEDETYFNMLAEKAENEQDLFDAGYVIESVEILDGKNNFATDPNAPSEWDEPDYLVRYKYMLRPNINESAIIPTTRFFCSNLINKNYVWRVEEMEALVNDQGSSALVWRGGYNCRHIWGKILYRKDATIINKASINKGKVDVGGFPSGLDPQLDILGYEQPSTITEKTLNNPSPSTIRNLGLSKQDFFGEKVSVDFDDTLSTFKGQQLAERLIRQGYSVYVVTRRQSSQSAEVYRIADKIGIPRQKVIFTNGKLKWETLKRLGIRIHIDNNPDEIKAIKENAPSIEAIKFVDEDINMDVYGYKTKYFQICPGAQATFKHLVSMENDEDTIGMIRSAAVVADSIFKIEDDVIKAENATPEQLQEAVVLVDDFKDIIHEIDERSEMVHDVSYMDGHIEKIASYVKEEMGYDVSTIVGYKDPGIYPKKKKKRDNYESYSDYPDSVKNNAKAVLKYAEENGWGSCGTEVGKIRANQLANGEAISEDTIRRMYSYLSRHSVDLDSSKGYGDGCGKLMYDAWGGKSALSWAEAKIKSIDKEKMSKQKFTTDDEKRIVLGPAMIPDLQIYRKDKNGNPYYVYFSEETIKMIAEKYMRNKYLDNNDMMHNGDAVSDVYVYESWIKEDMEDKSNKYGYGELPIGTWFVAMKVRNDDVWNKIKAGELRGFSVSGYFEEIAQFSKEDMFLYQLAQLLKNVD